MISNYYLNIKFIKKNFYVTLPFFFLKKILTFKIK